jgi:hypothetical protein
MAREALKRFAGSTVCIWMTRVRAADDFNAAATTSNALTSPHRLLARRRMKIGDSGSGHAYGDRSEPSYEIPAH